MKKLVIVSIVVFVFGMSMAFNSYCAEKKDKSTKSADSKITVKETQLPNIQPVKTNIIFGEIIGIDNVNSTITLKDQVTSKEDVLSFTPTTGVTKLTDVNDLKKGDVIRVIYQDQEGKKTARAIMFGKIKTAPILKASEQPVKKESEVKEPVKK